MCCANISVSLQETETTGKGIKKSRKVNLWKIRIFEVYILKTSF